MTRLIDADNLIEDIDGDLTDSIAEGRAIEKIMNAPTVDAIHVIRCRDCKHRMHDKTCIKVMKRKPDDGFCDEGERNV